ncbi:protein phosphatase 2C domain-containing protein [Luteipulveratus sp. YIM 133132]|uniref:protein phosphatase 2C domain-containing protein n=1 Tax=Luteipulveratus flavus TaxID=3031728 RepID=UPI0023AEEEB8|nr:protein phosphatase 2C domain-containing protein [Luteipulveratus sp. YIM 133132]MDE9367314.1 protein phosphatase 2C domain-containing protein [Luteipulveratus sp. YIM 133132]
MGTSQARVAVDAATLAGGDKNQDRYVVGDGYAAVLDGASSFSGEQPEHDGGWYAEHLADALERRLGGGHDHDTADLVADSIREVAHLHNGSAESCPTSTIALVRWSDELVEVYVLGDSTVVIVTDAEESVHTDARIEKVAPGLRAAYRQRLADGLGFDDQHRDLLAQLQVEQAKSRNSRGGYWIAGRTPDAAAHGLRDIVTTPKVRAIILATDGAAAAVERYAIAHTWRELADRSAEATLRATFEIELNDPQGHHFLRSKPHDDKTLVVARFAGGCEATKWVE